VSGLRRRQARFTGWVRGRLRPEQNLPLVLHITQHKAGSQWVAEILKNIAAPERIVLPQENGAHFTSAQLRPGAVVLTIYRPYAKVQAVTAGYTGPIRRFVVIRDLRDTLVSLYYSLRYSHPPQAIVIKNREALAHLDTEQGMMALLTLDPRSLWAQAEIAAPVRMKASESAGVQPEHNILDRIAHLQRSWLEVEDRLLVRYEDLVADEHGMFQRIVDYCAIEVPRARLYDVVAQNSFAVKTGRRVGQEDINSHQRKGIVGDWRNCFTDELKAEFKARYGEHLIATGYERDLNW
jgi:lipopolysaccharide transport system ATP-binding protein